jgi:hypothetical protein
VNTLIKDRGTKNHLSNAKLSFCPNVGKSSTNEGGQSIPLDNPEANSLPLELDWPRSKVHTLLNQLKFYSPTAQHSGQFSWAEEAQQESRQRSQKYRQFKWRHTL